MKNHFPYSAAVILAKLSFFLPLFFWLQACSQTPAPGSEQKQSNLSLLNDSTAVLGNSLDSGYRLFKNVRKTGDKSELELVLTRLQDMQNMIVAKLPETGPDGQANKPRFIWSKDSKYLIVENISTDTVAKHEMVLVDLQNFRIKQRNPGTYIAFDEINEVIFYYRATPERQNICFYDLKKPDSETERGITAAPVDKLPSIIFSYKDRRAKVKAFTTDDTPVNVAIPY